MQRFKISMLTAAGILVLAFVLTAIGPKQVMAALGYTPVRDVNCPGRQPFAMLVIAAPNEIPVSTANVAVPVGKRLVITSISAEIEQSNPGYFTMSTLIGGNYTTTWVPFSAGTGVYIANMNGYDIAQADAGTAAIHIGANTSQHFEVNIHGYLVDVP